MMRLFLLSCVLLLAASCRLSDESAAFTVHHYHTGRPEILHEGGSARRISFHFAGPVGGIAGEELGVLWQGRVRQPENGTLFIQHSDAGKLKLTIDGRTVPLGGSGYTELELEKGSHDVAVRYEPKWFAGDMAVHFLRERPLKAEEAADTLRKEARRAVVAFAQVSAHAPPPDPSGRATPQRQEAQLHVPAGDKPMILVLSSHTLTHVDLVAEQDADIRAVVALNGIADIGGTDAPVYRVRQDTARAWWPENCLCTGGVNFSCSGGADGLSEIESLGDTLFGKTPDYYHRQGEWLSAAAVQQRRQTALAQYEEGKAKCGGAQALRFDNAIPDSRSDQGWFAQIGGEVPEHGFKAYYFRHNGIGRPVAEEHVPHIAVNYTPEHPLHGIDPEQFAALWVGKIRVGQSTVMDMQYDLSWAQLRVRVDGKTVHEYRPRKNSSSGGGRFDLLLHPGEHLLEVEYINHWHTVGFSMHPLPKIFDSVQEDAEALLKHSGYSVVSAEVYGSSAPYNTVRLTLPHTEKPMVLLLRSHNSVFWHIQPDRAGLLKAVVMEDGKGTVSGSSAPVYRLQRLPRHSRTDWRFYQYETEDIRNFTAADAKP